MKYASVAGSVMIGTIFAASPVLAELKLDLGGYFRGYAIYANQDNAAGGTNSFEFRRDTEIHVTGETTLDNGLTVGFHTEQQLTTSTGTDEVYAYFSGNWGRINIGQEDGAAYLLQVAAPSADSNVDGLRSYINGLNGYGLFSLFTTATKKVDYANDFTRLTDRLTYISPKLNGLQAAISYAPSYTQFGKNIAGMGGSGLATNNIAKHLHEASLRWDGSISGFDLSIGGGYTGSDIDDLTNTFTDSLRSWNGGVTLSYDELSFGVAYFEYNLGHALYLKDNHTWVIGAAWDQGPYHLGASYMKTYEDTPPAFVQDAERLTIGGGYAFGPGMTVRGTVAVGKSTALGDNDFTQATLGTDIQF